MPKSLDPRRALGGCVRGLRQRAGLRQADLGQRAGCSRTTINEIERGKNNPTLDLIIAIAGALDVSVARLFLDRDLTRHGEQATIPPPGAPSPGGIDVSPSLDSLVEEALQRVIERRVGQALAANTKDQTGRARLRDAAPDRRRQPSKVTK